MENGQFQPREFTDRIHPVFKMYKLWFFSRIDKLCLKKIKWNKISGNYEVFLLSPLVFMHGGLLGVAFCLSLCPRIPSWRSKVIIWLLVGCELTRVQNLLVCNLRIDMWTFRPQQTRIDGKTQTWVHRKFLSPPVLMHGGLLGVAFCPSVRPSVCPSVTNTRKKVTKKKKSYLRNHLAVTKFCMVMNEDNI